ncbi:hypothetical protein ABEB36_015508 [Hypothenemus hampei]|uniref:Uncharacterized protein n=1 Tax=Hypothenemus hampei TaxID=57062 RepID=A0ABD1DZY5_HYPHA
MKETRALWVFKGISMSVRTRQRREILGTLLTSVFGVNDEIYTDIENLDRNQQELLKTSNHQTRFMMQALSTFNDTEDRIHNKLAQFEKKIKTSQIALDQMRGCIHILSLYQTADNYLDELYEYYKNLEDVFNKRGDIYKIIAPAQIEEILQRTYKKLPSGLEIRSTQITKTELQGRDDSIRFFLYFTIAEITTYHLIKAHAIPLALNHSEYWTVDIPEKITAVDYNNQNYFQIDEQKLKENKSTSEHSFITSPDIIRNIENLWSVFFDLLKTLFLALKPFLISTTQFIVTFSVKQNTKHRINMFYYILN